MKGADFGSDKDGKKTCDFCFHCYKGGDFIDGCSTIEQKTERLVNPGMLKLGMSETAARNMALMTLPKLPSKPLENPILRTNLVLLPTSTKKQKWMLLLPLHKSLRQDLLRY